MENLKKAIKNTMKYVIFSDANLAMHNAIKEQFPKTYTPCSKV